MWYKLLFFDFFFFFYALRIAVYFMIPQYERNVFERTILGHISKKKYIYIIFNRIKNEENIIISLFLPKNKSCIKKKKIQL